MDLKQQVEQQRITFEAAVSTALDIAKTKASAAEVMINKSSGISVSSRMGEVENVEFNSDGALGITVYRGKRKGSASTTDLSPKAIEQTVLAALDIAKYTSEDDFSGPAPAELMVKKIKDLDLFHPQEADPDKAAQMAIAAELAALNYSDKITQSDGASYDSHYGIRVYGNSHGLLVSSPSSRHSISCSVIGKCDNGDMERDHSYSVARCVDDLWTPEFVGLEAAKHTLKRLNPRKVKTGKYPVIFAADIATGLFGHLIGAISGGSLYRKSSFLLDKLGEQIFPQWLNINENPFVLKGFGSSSFDAEGVFTQERAIIDNGTLATYLLPSYAARKMKMPPTGHAGGIYNWFVQNSGQSLEQLLKEMGTGLLVTDVMGQGVNTVTGDYSRGAAGFWVENGKIQYPVSELTIAGNLADMMMQINAIGTDTETRSQIQTGSVWIDSMNIGGQ